MRIQFFSAILISFLIQSVYSQEATIRGTVFDATTGEYLPGVTIYAEGTAYGTITDIDGEFSMEMAPGSYDIRVSFISYETVILKDIECHNGEATVLEEIGLKTANIDIEEVVITAQTIRNTENALMSMKKRSVNVMDGISAASLRKIGDSDAAASIKRVSGVSVTGGKYVYIRGLGDRYTKTIMNGLDIPGLDPDRNAIQMDLFPTSIIDNIMVHKTFSADLPADFTGGVIDIEIKDFPAKKSASLSASTGYNSSFHFHQDFLSYKGGSTDFLGFDDGSRRIPAKTDIPEFAYALGDFDGPTGQRYRDILNGFNPIMAASPGLSFMDYGFSASYANQVNKKKADIGYNFGFSYKNNTELYTDAINARYGMNAIPDVYELEVREYQNGDFGTKDVFLSGLAGFARKTNRSKIRTYLLHLQNGKSTAGIFDFEGSDQGSNFTSLQHVLDFSQRSLTNIFIDGKHRKPDSDWELVWKASPSLSILYDPDVRFSRYETNDNGSFQIGTEVGFPERIWRNLMETDVASSAHATRSFLFRDRESKLKLGGAYTFKYRTYSIITFKLNVRGGDNGNLSLTGDPDELLSEALKWPYNGDARYGTAFENDLNPANSYNANVNYFATYASTDLALSNRLKASIGLRAEEFYQRYTGQNQSGSEVLDNEVVLNDLKLFPTVNLILNTSQNQNLRLSYSKTVARPSLKELSYAEIYDPLSGRTFIGGLHDDTDPVSGITYWNGNLVSTDIHNFDIRWEHFSTNAQMISLSGFYKKFINPIEMVQFATQTGAFQPRNVGNGNVYGAEVELRQNLGFISEVLQPISINTNFTYTESSIELSSTEYESRIYNKRTGQEVTETRIMAGQSPYLVNAGISYNGGTSGWWKTVDAGLYYNVQGTTLQFVGIADRPDVYSLPFHSLNFNSNMSFGNDHQYKLGIKFSNILGSKREMVYKSYQAADQYFEYRDPGKSISVSFGYTFF
ncbi:MAG: TonB-dependent receptor [Bacteroidales bacterium]|nr:TonB-dependent receptor [Bacteroidales bacterium]